MTESTDQKIPCPVWNEGFGTVTCEDLQDYRRFYSPRAGGAFLLADDLLQKLPLRLSPRECANLSWRIYQHNWHINSFQIPLKHPDGRIVRGDAPLDRLLKVTPRVLAEVQQARIPIKERLLSFLRELIWQQDNPVQLFPTREEERPEEELTRDEKRKRWERQKEDDDQETIRRHLLLRAASGSASLKEFAEFWDRAQQCRWLQDTEHIPSDLASMPRPTVTTTLEARLWVEEQERAKGQGEQGFVAMWFDDAMRQVYSRAINPAIRNAGYRPHRIDDDPNHSDDLVDRILAAIR